MNDVITWVGIGLCVTQSAALSGLNLALFSLSRLRLEVAAHTGDPAAARVLALRADANRTLVTILWGNVAVNVLLTLLADSVLAGVASFLFSTVIITFAGEIIPQAYFTRHALAVAARLAPLLRVYRVLLYPIAKPVGMLLDRTVGPESTPWFREAELRAVLSHHARAEESEVGPVEAAGAINFLALDDIPVAREGEPLDPDSVVTLPFEGGKPVFPEIARSPDDAFLRRIAASGRKWVVLTDDAGEPRQVVNAHLLLRNVLFGEVTAYEDLCHRPLVVRDPGHPLGEVLSRLTVRPERPGDDVVDEDLILVWVDGDRRIITGSDLLGRLLRGIVRIRPA
jgi:metal transporter CNNM